MSDPLYVTTPVQYASGGCLKGTITAPFVLFGAFSLLMAALAAQGLERLWFALSGAVALAVPWLGRRLFRPVTLATRLSVDTEGTVTLHLARGEVVMPSGRLARIVTGSVTRSVQGVRTSRGVVLFVDPDGEQLAQVQRSDFLDADLGRFFEAVRGVRPDLVVEHR